MNQSSKDKGKHSASKVSIAKFTPQYHVQPSEVLFPQVMHMLYLKTSTYPFSPYLKGGKALPCLRQSWHMETRRKPTFILSSISVWMLTLHSNRHFIEEKKTLCQFCTCYKMKIRLLVYDCLSFSMPAATSSNEFGNLRTCWVQVHLPVCSDHDLMSLSSE